MKHRWMVLTCACVLGVLGRGARGQTTEQKSFDAKMYSIEAIDHFGTGDEKYAALTDMQKRSLVEARNDLMDMLQAIQHKRDVTKYVSQGMALVGSIIDPETSILAAGISEFDFVDKGAIRLKFFALVFSEGNIVVSEKAAVLKSTDSGWRVEHFE